MATSFNNAAPIPSGPGSLGALTTAPAAAPAATTVAPAAQPAGNAAVGTTYSPVPSYDAGSTFGGGTASSRLAAAAQSTFARFQQMLDRDVATATANGTNVDPAKMQQYQMQLSSYELIMQLAAKIQEKQDRAAQVWLQL